MLTPEEKKWCREMAIEMRLIMGAKQITYSSHLHLAFTIDLN